MKAEIKLFCLRIGGTDSLGATTFVVSLAVAMPVIVVMVMIFIVVVVVVMVVVVDVIFVLVMVRFGGVRVRVWRLVVIGRATLGTMNQNGNVDRDTHHLHLRLYQTPLFVLEKDAQN